MFLSSTILLLSVWGEVEELEKTEKWPFSK